MRLFGPAWMLIVAAAVLLPAQSDPVTAEQPVRTVQLAASIASPNDLRSHFLRLVSRGDTLTALAYRGRDAAVIRTSNEGQVVWQTSFRVDDADDLVVTPSGGVDVLVVPDASMPAQLVDFDASGNQISSSPAGDLIALCVLGDSPFWPECKRRD
jgi:hypothetical protein